ncbi:MAG: protein kinase, partial [Planctomycetes bacterium]|nr:protein kinase [Planctomycetota bacterium]
MPDDEQLTERLLQWEELRQSGENRSASDLCADSVELTDELADRMDAIRAMESLLGVATKSDPIDSPDDSNDDMAEHRPEIPGYELLGVLDRGGMGVVYKARQVDLARVVALKMIGGVLVGPKHLARFRAEAEAIAHLHHPNIVQIFDIGETQGFPYFSMEFVEGGSLKQRLERSPMSVDDSVQLVATVARTIHIAHERGIVHRDLKPANILLTVDGVPKITDFGLAKRLDEDSGHTGTGEILGTLNYMAPEQVDQSIGEVGAATDVYALGAILYELLTEQPPFRGPPVSVLQQHLKNEPNLPSKTKAGLPRDLDAICLKCLAKPPSRRYETGEELADDLQRFLDHRPIKARRIGATHRTLKWIKRHPQAVLLFLLAVGLLAFIPGIQAFREYQAQEQAREELRTRAVALAPQAREILKRNCFACHGETPDSIEKKLDVLNHRLLLDSKRKIVIPFRPDDSRLIQRIADGSMPPAEFEEFLPRLSDKEVSILTQWIEGGAPAFAASDPDPATPPVVQYSEIANQAKEVFVAHCYECHKFDVGKGGIKILHHRLLVNQRKVVVPGDPAASELFDLITRSQT